MKIKKFFQISDLFESTKKESMSRIDAGVLDVIDFLDDLNEFRYRLKLRLSNVNQLKSMLKEYEEMEEYEKCSEIQKEIESKKL